MRKKSSVVIGANLSGAWNVGRPSRLPACGENSRRDAQCCQDKWHGHPAHAWFSEHRQDACATISCKTASIGRDACSTPLKSAPFGSGLAGRRAFFLKTENRKLKTRFAFSLIELLAVVAVMVLLLSLAVPALNGVMEGGRVTQAATILAGQFSVGHLKAIGENRPITLRFIRGKEDKAPFDRIQLLATSNNTLVAVDRVATLPVGTAIAQSATLSSLFDPTLDPSLSEKTATGSDPSVPGLGTAYRYIQFSFRPRGSLDLDITKKWFVTVVLLRADQAAGVPANYITLQLDPVNGGFVTYQP